MNTVQLVPKPGQTSSIGNGPVYFTSPNAPVVGQGDQWSIFAPGQTPNRAEIGHNMPWEVGLTYDGAVDPQGILTISGQCAMTGPHNITDGFGVVLAVGVLPGGGIQLAGYYACQFQPAPPPAPAPVPGLALLLAAVQASWQSRIPVASSYTDFAAIPYTAAPPYLPAPIAATVPVLYALSNAKAAAVAALLGGTVAQAPAAGYFFDPWAVDPATNTVDGWQPAVNWIHATINGVAMKALGMALVAAFNSNAGNLEANVLATFTAA